MPLKIELKDLPAASGTDGSSKFIIITGTGTPKLLAEAALPGGGGGGGGGVVCPDDGFTYALTVRLMDGVPTPALVRL